jgi:hypothetical protein
LKDGSGKSSYGRGSNLRSLPKPVGELDSKFCSLTHGIAVDPVVDVTFPLLPVSAGSFVAACVMHGLAVELGTVLGWTLAAGWHGAAVALAKIETMIDVSVEMVRSAIPRSRADK